jgi:hypothetical protein
MNDELTRQIVERARSGVPNDRIVTADEAAEWPGGSIDALLREGFLQEIQPAMTVECDACFERHVEVVEFVEEPPGSELRAYIVCPESGRVKVDTQRMRRWEIQPQVSEQHVPAGTTGTEASENSADVKTPGHESVWPPTAEAFVETLRQAHHAGALYLRWREIKERLNAKGHYPNRARDVRRNVPDWDKVVASPRRGVYQLKS